MKPTEKKCPRCGECKSLAEFNSNRCKKDGYAVYCRPCTRQYSNTHYAKQAHDCIVSKVYGIERGQYAVMLKAQKGRCAICRRKETAMAYGRVRRLAIDHNHKTGAVRGLLCAACNRGLEGFKDSPARLQAAIKYLQH